MPKRTVLVILVTAVLAASCGSDDSARAEPCSNAVESSSGGMTIQDGDLVEVHYTGTLDDGEQFDSSYDRGTPLSFTVASGQVIPGFDDAVLGLSVGDQRTCSMSPERAYGERSDDDILELPFGASQADVAVGDEVFLTNGQPAVVLEVKEGTVVLDANHKLAGKTLTFSVEVVSVTRP